MVAQQALEDLFYVPASTKNERFAALLSGPFFVAFAAMEIAVGLPWFVVPLIVAGLSTLWTTWRGFRLARRGIVFDADGIAPAEDGERLWTLPWKDFGGFRPGTATLWERLRYPERDGYEILDRAGQILFCFTLPPQNATTGPLIRAAKQELRRHLPLGAPDPLAPVVRPPQAWVIAAGVSVAVLGVGCAKAGLANPLSPLFGLGLVGSFMGLGGALVAALETISLVRWARGWRPTPSELPTVPDEGPALDHHVARHARKLIELKEGRRYRTVDPERTRRNILYTARLLRGMAVAYGLVGIVILVIALHDLEAGLVGVGFGISMIAFGLWMEITARGSRARLTTLDDVLWVHEGQLIVVRPERAPLVLSLPKTTDRKALRRRALVGRTDEWRISDGTRYAIDRTRLYEAPNVLGTENL